MATLQINCLGTFRATLAGKPVVFEADKTRALLAYLVLESAYPQRRERLAGLLWSDLPEQRALHNLRQALSKLRKALQDDVNPVPYLLIQRDTVQINAAGDYWVDVIDFEQKFGAALRNYRHCPGESQQDCYLNLRQLQQAVQLFRAPFLDQLYLSGSPLFDEWASIQREALNQKMLEALSILVDISERRAEIALARQYANQIVDLAPWDEIAQTQAIRLLAVEGQWSIAQTRYRQLQQYLRQQIGVEPSAETLRLQEQIQRAAAANTPFPARYPPPLHNLARPSTAFVGRESELDALANALAEPGCRLITLTGPGGIGKTRLALAAAHDQLGLFSGGVHAVALASVDASALLSPHIADALGFMFFSSDDPSAQLIDFLREKNLLLLLDNYEQLLPDTELLVNLLEQAPGVKLLVTSRQPLNLRSEQVFEIDGLAYPAAGALDAGPAAIRDFSAAQLFERTAQRVQPKFSLDGETPAVVRICQLLAGHPLGLELAAAWVRFCDVRAIADQIEQDLDFLTSEMRDLHARHRSLRAVFEHSWHLLSPELQQIYASLSVFHGGFTGEAAGQVCAAEPAQLTSLVECSLLREVSLQRYEILSVLSQFAGEKLQDTPGQASAFRQRHSLYYATWLAQQAAQLHSPHQQATLARITQDIENVYASWQWALDQRQVGPIDLALPVLSDFYRMLSRFKEGHDLISGAVQALQSSPAGAAVARSLARLSVHQAAFEVSLGNYPEALRRADAAVEMLRAEGQPAELALALELRANALFESGEYQRAQLDSDEGLAQLACQGDSPTRALLYGVSGDARRVLGDYEAADQQYQAMLGIYSRLADGWGLAQAYNSLGILAGTRGQYPEAQVYFENSLETFRAIGDRSGTARILHNLSILSYIEQDYAKTRQLRLECLEICRAIGFQWGITSELKHLADVEKVVGNYAQAHEYYAESLAYSQRTGNRKSMVYTLNSLGSLSLAQKELEMARRYYFEALNLARELALTPVMIDILCGIAEVLAEAGQVENALELLAFTAQHPAVDQQTAAKATALAAELSVQIPPEQAARCQELGQQATLELVLARLAAAESAGR